MWDSFKAFIMRGNVVDMAIGIVVGSAFTAIARSMVDDVLMPPVGLLLGNVDFSQLYVLLKAGATPPPYASLQAAQEAGAVTINLGLFVNAVVSFLIVAFVAFLIVRAVTELQRRERQAEAPAPTTKDCPFCYTAIPVKASRCPNCTSQLAGG